MDWKVLVPHLQSRHCLLLLDLYEGYKSDQLKDFMLRNHPHIHFCIIPDGYTDALQPLDMGMNASFKRTCKDELLSFINQQTLEAHEKISIMHAQKINFNLIISKVFHYILYFVDDDENWMFTEKNNVWKSQDKKPVTVPIQVEDIYS